MKILKFGGSSVATPERINQVIDILTTYYQTSPQFSVVFSAFGGATDMLIQMSKEAEKGKKKSYNKIFQNFSDRHLQAAQELISKELLPQAITTLKDNHNALQALLNGVYLTKEASPRIQDFITSFGERNSAFIIQQALVSRGLPANYLDARKVITTNSDFGNAKVLLKSTTKKIQKHYRQHQEAIQIVTGFIGATKTNITTTLGRGGSDYTASILAAALHADILEIWTDVSGVLTADPCKVTQAAPIPQMSYMEAMEMSHFGAKVIYPPTIQPVLQKDIPLTIKNTFAPTDKGTYISALKSAPTSPVRGISSIGEISLITLQGSGLFGVPGIAARLFGALADAQINIILITQGSSEHSISFAIAPSKTKLAKKTINRAFKNEFKEGLIDPLKVESDLSTVAIIGEGMRYSAGIAGRLFSALGQNNINIVAIAQGSSELNISFVIKKDSEVKALNVIHQSFFEENPLKTVHLYLCGTGLIASTLINQLHTHKKQIEGKNKIKLVVKSLTNSKKMLQTSQGIDLDWQTQLTEEGKKANLDAFIVDMIQDKCAHRIFIDNTASELPTHYYQQILEAGIAISTPNKTAAASSYATYAALKAAAQANNTYYEYETNVGAGLPVISTIRDLIQTGDEITKIEGILSGSLSYIFNTFQKGSRFSDVVLEAKKLGYTEPDPRDDLSGKDVSRKIAILAREAGAAIELEDITISPILPKACFDAKGTEAFFEVLEQENAYFDQLHQDNKALRFIATYEADKASIRLQAVGSNHPFYNMSGSDNIIAITTSRYTNPLVIKGAGAGAEVTAAGVFAEILKISKKL